MLEFSARKVGPEGVDAGQRQAVGLHVELAGHGEERRAAEEVLREVDRAVGRARQVGQVQRGDAEHLAGALGVAGGDDRRVDPEEAALVEEAVDGHGQRVCRTRATAPKVLVRARRWATSRRNSKVWRLGWIG